MSDGPIAVAERGVALRLEGVRRVFDNQLVVIGDLSLSIDAGEFLAVTGPSGPPGGLNVVSNNPVGVTRATNGRGAALYALNCPAT